MAPPSRFNGYIAAFAAICAGCHLARGALTSNPGPFLEDDSYFYAQIAYNIGVHHRSSFDLLHPTDGYHLLWAGVLSTATWLLSFVTLEKELHLTGMLSVYIALVAGTAVYFGRTAFERAVLFTVGLSGAYLMESALLTLLLLTVLRYVLGGSGPDRYVCAALALIPLARIDAVFIALVWLLRPLIERKWSDAARLALWLAAGVVVHFAAMYLVHGHFTTVSSELKALQGVAVGSNMIANLLSPETIRRSLLVGAFLVFAVVTWAATGSRWEAAVGLLAPTLFLAAHVAMNASVKSWYSVPVLQCYVFTAFALARHRAVAWIPRVGFAAFAVYYVASRFYFLDVNREMASATVAFVQDVQAAVPIGQSIFHTDGGGYVGFVSGRRVINGDGLVNSHDYARGLRDGTLAGYLQANGVRYVITNTPTLDPAATLERYGGMRITRARLLLESRAARLPENTFWAYRLYEVQ